MRLGICAILVLPAAVGLTAPDARAWDQHWMVTAATMRGFAQTDPTLYAKLAEGRVRVTPIEEFLERAFGPACDWQTARDRVFNGVGDHYEVYYAQDYRQSFTLDWDQGLNVVVTQPANVPEAQNPQRLGQVTSPFEVLRVYSDEPDHQLDDDVARLRGVGAAGKTAGGIATRSLRHFWYKGEIHYGVDFGAGQETDRRMQLYTELALVAFEVGEPYWGYRFMANALHYIQDLTQPFHVHALVNSSMVDELGVAHAYLCDDMRARGKAGERCRAEDTLDRAVIESGWAVGTYHLMYEEFARSLMEAGEYGTASWVASRHEAEPVIARGSDGLPDLLGTPTAERKVILGLSDAVGKLAYQVFGSKFKYDAEACRMQFETQGKPYSDGYRLGNLANGDEEFLLQSMKQSQVDAIYPLVAATHAVLARAGEWGRAYLRLTLDAASAPGLEAARGRLRGKYAAACGIGPTAPPL
jgi:hypothetical protein